MTALYRVPAALDAPAPWRWTWARVADAIGLWRWPWGRRWGGGRWAMYAVVPLDGTAVGSTVEEERRALAAYYGGSPEDYFAMSTWADAETVRWRPVDHCPHGAFIAPVWPDGRLAMLWCACDCEVHPNCGEASP
ncbi:MAG: hypothetical protein Q8S73_12580 [Deltaproteobacteria bacterium]|nr:hypothetical protein [Myxococcales bacterium]MDP3214935.1 hypothetical protein [Deltaproteobacteria bacterium]